MNRPSVTWRPATLVYWYLIVSFALILINGYALNAIGLPAHATLIFLLTLIELGGIRVWLRRQHAQVNSEWLGLAGFITVTLATWIYFLLPALPTLLPPSFSGDAANHAAFANTVFASGKIIEDYPGGPALVVATFAHWLGNEPVRLLHPLSALWLAIMAGGIYLGANLILPTRPRFTIIALCAPTALFLLGNYFTATLIGLNYFSTQVFAQMMLVAFCVFWMEHRAAPSTVWLSGMALTLIGISVSFQLWLVLPGLLFGVHAWNLWRREQTWHAVWRDARLVVGIPAFFWIALIALTGLRYIPHLSRFGSQGAVLLPSLSAFGGGLLILPALSVILRPRGTRVWIPLIVLMLAAFISAIALALRAVGLTEYWYGKSFYVWIIPLTWLAVLPLARMIEWIPPMRIAPALAFFILASLIGGGVVYAMPPEPIAVMSESDLDVALWAKAHLDTRQINLIGKKSILANWLGVGIWGEHYPAELFIDFAALGPKTFEEWRAEPSWGDYLFAPSATHLPVDTTLQTVYQVGATKILRKPDQPPATRPAPLAQIGDVLTLTGATLPVSDLAASATLTLTAQFIARAVPTHQVMWRLQLRNHQDEIVSETQVPAFPQFPLQRWSPQAQLTQTFSLTLPANIQPGAYALGLSLLYETDGTLLPFTRADGTSDDVWRLGPIKVALAPNAAEFANLTHADLVFDQAFALLGYAVPATIHPGEPLRVTIVWQCRAAAPRDYTVFVHLLNAANQIVAQRDSAPRDGTYPTSIWATGETIPDAYTLELARDLPPGEYRIEIGMYEFPSLRRLPITRASQAIGDHVELTTRIQVTAP